jgi:hypothetical protein
MKTVATRLERLEESAGHCRACANAAPVVRVRGGLRLPTDDPEPPEGAGVCQECGHDRTVTVEFVLTRAAGPVRLEAPRHE